MSVTTEYQVACCTCGGAAVQRVDPARHGVFAFCTACQARSEAGAPSGSPDTPPLAIPALAERGDRWRIFCGDVLEVLRRLPDASFDACLTDPPYGLGPREPTAEEIVAYLIGDGGLDTGGDFMGTSWEIPPVAVWRELARVLRLGAPSLAFSGSKTLDLIGIGLRVAGLERDDTLMWLYGEAMPKPATKTDVFIDKYLGAEREVVGDRVLTGNSAVSTRDKGGTVGIGVGTVEPIIVPITAPATEEAKRWEGYGSALRPSFEPIALVHKPSGKTIARTCIEHGVGALNVNGCRLGRTGGTRKVDREKYKTNGVALDGSADGSLNGGVPESIGAGRWPPNVLMTHHPECVEIGTKRVKASVAVKRNGVTENGPVFSGTNLGIYKPGTKDVTYGDADGFETVREFDCHPDCPVRLLDDAVGDRRSTLTGRADPGTSHANPGDNAGSSSFGGGNSRVYADRGGPSRYMYTSKVSPVERELGCESLPLRPASECVLREEDSVGIQNGMAGAGRIGGYRNHHKTLKPIAVTRWLATLLLPPPRADGRPRRILVPYSGAGSEMIGALRAGWDEVIGIERDVDYIAIAKARITRWLQARPELDEAEVVRSAAPRSEHQADLFAGVLP